MPSCFVPLTADKYCGPTRVVRALLWALFGLLLSAHVAVAQIEVTSPSVIEHAARPGERFEGAIVVHNTSAVEQDVRVYQTDYQFSADGRSAFPQPGTLSRSNARWISLTPSRFRIGALGTVRVGYVAEVPSAVAPSPGSFWSVVMIEAISAGSPELSRSNAPTRARLGLAVAVRHAVQIAVNVDGANARVAMQLGNSKLSTSPAGTRQLALDALNSGELAVHPMLRLEVLDDAGHCVARAEQQRGLVYPGSSVHQQFDLGPIPSGTYHAVVVADTGGDELFAAKFTLQF